MESAQIFKALSDPQRLHLLETLCSCGCELSVGDLDQCCEIDMSVVSRHLSRLRGAGLVKADRRGRSVFYSADGASVAETLRSLADVFEACGTKCCGASPNEKNKPKKMKHHE